MDNATNLSAIPQQGSFFSFLITSSFKLSVADSFRAKWCHSSQGWGRSSQLETCSLCVPCSWSLLHWDLGQHFGGNHVCHPCNVTLWSYHLLQCWVCSSLYLSMSSSSTNAWHIPGWARQLSALRNILEGTFWALQNICLYRFSQSHSVVPEFRSWLPYWSAVWYWWVPLCPSFFTSTMKIIMIISTSS